ncbi:hypothetical protein [Polaromonas hydrogenivorans]|uniref:Uncharacterized protein n=1 Tax=Polaromonas hydrogenivorans TaxID=335476 RepID=A0AAU7LWN4_9BURK
MSLCGLEGFKLKAVVDRIRFEVTLNNPSQFRHLQNRTAAAWGKTYFFPQDASGLVWEFWVQDPAGPTQFMTDVQAMRGSSEPLIAENQIRITGIEMAIDAYHPSNDIDALVHAALHFLRHRANLANGLPRIPRPPYFDSPILAAQWEATKAADAAAKAEARRLGAKPPPPLDEPSGMSPAVESPAHALWAFKHGLGIHQGKAPDRNTGKCEDAVGQHFYVKTTDTVKGGETHALLPSSAWRARMEDRLQRDDPQRHPPLPFDTIGAWRTFRFATLAERFAMVVPKPPRSPMLALCREQHGTQFGRIPGAFILGRRKRANYTLRDTATNDSIRMALKALDSPAKLSKR